METPKKPTLEGYENTAIGTGAFKQATKASRCICLGDRAGEWITDEDYLFCIATSGEEPIEFRTQMTEAEWHVINTVVKRALLNGHRMESQDAIRVLKGK